MTAEEYRGELEIRGRQLLEQIAPSTSSLWGAQALMAAGEQEKAAEILRNAMTPTVFPDGSRAVSTGTFDLVATMLLVCRWGEMLPESVIAQVREAMAGGILHRGNTENHWLMYYTGSLLGAERWPDIERWWNGLSREAAHAEAMRWITGMMDRTARQGHHEYDSPQYHACHLLCMIALADHAADPDLRAQAEQMATLYVADMALEYFHGAWAGGHSREGYLQNTWTLVGTAAALAFYYFGDVAFDPEAHAQDMACPAVTAQFRPPAMLAERARDRERPYVVKKTKAPRTIYRHVTREAEPVRKYTYLSPSFALGSTQVGLPGAPAGPIDLVSWDLSWAGPKHQAKVVCNHPYLSPGRFGAFLSEVPQMIGRSVAEAHKPYLQNPDRLFGASPYEQMVQHESAIVVLYRIPPEDRAPYVHLYLPKGMAWAERAGWILGDGESFYIGIRPIGRYRWLEIHEEPLVDGWLLRIDGSEVGIALEAEEAGTAGTFEAFCDEMARPRLDLSGWPEPGCVAFETQRGPRLEIVYDGPHRVDGVEIDYDAWPLYEAPGVEGPLGTGRVTLQQGTDRLELDFGVDPAKPMLPMRVIG